MVPLINRAVDCSHEAIMAATDRCLFVEENCEIISADLYYCTMEENPACLAAMLVGIANLLSRILIC